MDLVKRLDDFPERLDHVGVALWDAAQLWKARFDAAMIERGYPWFGQARSAVIPHVGRAGVRQADLVRHLRLSKQAVQQLVDELVADGIVERRPDPEDRRGRIVVFAPAGKRALADANTVKRQVEAEFRERLGADDFDRLAALLGRLNGAPAASAGGKKP